MVEEPETKYAMAFFDGQNVYQHAKAAFGHHHPNFNPAKLHKAVCAAKGWAPNLVRFYTGVPDVADSPMWGGYWSNRILAMKREGIIVTHRKLRYHDKIVNAGSADETIIRMPQEKGVDVRLSLDVVSLARKRQFNVAIIYSQDQDLAEVVREVKDISREQNRWIRVACAFPAGPKATAGRGIDGADWFRMNEEFYNACLDDRDYRPKNYRA